MLVATLFPAYEDSDLVEAAIVAPKKIVASWEQAIQWAEAEMAEGRDEQEWKRTDGPTTPIRQEASWKVECNEDGTEEEWLLVVEDVQPWKA